MSLSLTPLIFVDDTDPNIIYSGSWAGKIFDATNSSSFPITPLYETLHVLVADSAEGKPLGNMSYAFNGSSIIAYFIPLSEEKPLMSCEMDGQDVPVTFIPSQQMTIFCEFNYALPEGTHKLVVSSNSTLAFDYMVYTAIPGTSPGGDVIHYDDDPAYSIVPASREGDILPGGSLDFDFFGYSLGLYLYFAYGDSHVPSNASYTVDDQTPVNFTVKNPTTKENAYLGPELVVQTPRYSLGQHHFHLDFMGTKETTPFNFTTIVVQNSTSHTDLEPIPPIPSTASQTSTLPSTITSQSPSTMSLGSERHKASHVGLAVGVAVGVIAMLILIYSIIFYRKRKQNLSSDAHAVQPFIVPTRLQIGRAKDRDVEHLQDRARAKSGQQPQNVVPLERISAPRIIMHVDSEDQANEPESPPRIVELPPAYRSVRGSHIGLPTHPSPFPLLPSTEVIHITKIPTR